MSMVYINDPEEIADLMIDYIADGEYCTAIGDYETIVTIFNALIKSTDAEFVEGNLMCDDEGAPWYIDFDAETIWVDSATDMSGSFIGFDVGRIFIDVDYLTQYLKKNTNEDIVTFAYKEYVKDECESDPHLMIDDDRKGFCFCDHGDGSHFKFKYRGSIELSIDDISKILNECAFED